MAALAEGLEVMRIYWTRGPVKGGIYRNEVKDPPNAGWSSVLVLRGDKRITLLCPYSLESYQVSSKSAEVHSMSDSPQLPDAAKVVEILRRNWAMCQGFGWVRDYDVAARVFKLLGAEVPEQIMRGGEEDTRRRGGKVVGTALTKPVKKDSKRGKFLEWFMAGKNARSVREAMIEFDMSRSNALSYLFMLRKDHGIGYDLQGDIAALTFPEGCTDPFVTQEELNARDDTDDTDAELSETEDDDTEDLSDSDDEPGDDPDSEADDEPAPADDEDDDDWLN